MIPALLLLLSFAVCGYAEPAPGPLPEDTRLIALSDRLSASWVLDRTASGECRLTVDPEALPWLACRGRFLVGAHYAAMFAMDKPLDDAVWLDSGLLFAASRGELGALPVIDALKSKDAREMRLLKFKSLGRFPMAALKLAAGQGNSLYVFGRDAKTGKENIFQVRSDNGRWSSVFLTSTASEVKAVTGTGQVVFAAIGRKVVRLALSKTKGEKTKAKVIFTHPDSDITALAYSPKLGLYYATAEGVGYLGGQFNFEFLSSPGTQIALKGSSLFVMLSGQRGVVKISGLEDFREIDRGLAASAAAGDGQEGGAQ